MDTEGRKSRCREGWISKSMIGGVLRTGQQRLIAKWKRRQRPVQLFGVARHAERGDSIYAFVNEQRWTSTSDFHQWPLDPPLSDAGMEAAKEMGSKVQRFAMEQASPVHVVISSPYFRCIQTAVFICKALSPSAKLLIDRSLGEVYGSSVMGPKEPTSPVRGMDQTMAFCQMHGVPCQTHVIGVWPSWSEKLDDARKRYAIRFLSFLQRSTTTQRNFFLVTHADGVGAILSTMPSQLHRVVERVELGGMFLARRGGSGRHKNASMQCSSLSSVIPVGAELPGQNPEESLLCDFEQLSEGEGTVSEPEVPHGAWTADNACCMHSPKRPSKACPPLEAPKASDGWEVDLYNIVTHKRQATAKFQKRLKALASHGLLTQEKIEALLGDKDAKPLGNEELRSASILSPDPSCFSLTTYLFGSSEVGSTCEIESLDDLTPRLDASMTSEHVKQQWQHTSTNEHSLRLLRQGHHTSVSQAARSKTQAQHAHHKPHNPLSCGSGSAQVNSKHAEKAAATLALATEGKLPGNSPEHGKAASTEVNQQGPCLASGSCTPTQPIAPGSPLPVAAPPSPPDPFSGSSGEASHGSDFPPVTGEGGAATASPTDNKSLPVFFLAPATSSLLNRRRGR